MGDSRWLWNRSWNWSRRLLSHPSEVKQLHSGQQWLHLYLAGSPTHPFTLLPHYSSSPYLSLMLAAATALLYIAARRKKKIVWTKTSFRVLAPHPQPPTLCCLLSPPTSLQVACSTLLPDTKTGLSGCLSFVSACRCTYFLPSLQHYFFFPQKTSGEGAEPNAGGWKEEWNSGRKGANVSRWVSWISR